MILTCLRLLQWLSFNHAATSRCDIGSSVKAPSRNKISSAISCRKVNPMLTAVMRLAAIMCNTKQTLLCGHESVASHILYKGAFTPCARRRGASYAIDWVVAVCDFSHRPRTGSGQKLGRARQTVQLGGPTVYGDFMCFTWWQHYRSTGTYCRSMVNHLNPRPVVYDFCRHYFAHCWREINRCFYTIAIKWVPEPFGCASLRDPELLHKVKHAFWQLTSGSSRFAGICHQS